MPLGPAELAIIAVLVVFLFGARKLPEFGRAIGETLAELRKGVDDDR